jgi:hypothetical protein
VADGETGQTSEAASGAASIEGNGDLMRSVFVRPLNRMPRRTLNVRSRHPLRTAAAGAGGSIRSPAAQSPRSAKGAAKITASSWPVSGVGSFWSVNILFLPTFSLAQYILVAAQKPTS